MNFWRYFLGVYLFYKFGYMWCLLFSIFEKSIKDARALFFCLVMSFLLIVPKTVGATAPTVFEISGATTMGRVYGGTSGTVGVKIAQKYVPEKDEVICNVYHKVAQTSSGGGVVMRITKGGSVPEFVLPFVSVHVAEIPMDFLAKYVKFPLSECITLSSGSTYWFSFEPKNLVTFGSTYSFYSNVDQFPNSSHWQYNGFAFTGGAGWRENTGREWSLKLEGPEPPPKKQPVIIVPGILGSKLNRASDGEEVWPNTGNLFFQKTDVFLNELIGDEKGVSIVDIYAPKILDSAFSKNIYGDLVGTFLDAGYASGTELFTVPYDWRLRIASSTEKLDSVVKKAIAESPTGKVSIIAHSMGGLLVKEYLRQSSSTDFVDKLILAGVPELGSPKAFKALTYGDNFGFGFWAIDIFNSDRSKIISQNMPGVYELLPSRKYFDKGGWPYIYDSSDDRFRMPDFAGSFEFMLKDPDDSRNQLLLSSADEFHSVLDDAGFNAPKDSIYRFAGCQNPKTLGVLKIKPDNEFDVTPIDGDGTVPLVSATHSSAGHEYYALYSKTGINHMSLVGDDRTLGIIKGIVTNASTTLPEGISQNISDCGFIEPNAPNETTIAFSTHSPVFLHIYDNLGRHTGPDAEGIIELGIPGSSYEVIGDNSFAWAPGGGEYKIVIDAYNSGNFDLKIKKMNGVSVVNQSTYLNVPLQDEKTEASIDVGPQGEISSLSLDENGDGVVDSTIGATAFLEGDAAVDADAPLIAFGNMNEGAHYLHSDYLSPAVSISDSSSGIADKVFELDGKLIEDESAIDLFQFKVGEHVLVVTAVDKAGNSATASRNFVLEASKNSIKADINRMMSLGWITKDFDTVLAAKVDELSADTKGSFLLDLSGYKSKCYITSQAYEVLKNNIELILL